MKIKIILLAFIASVMAGVSANAAVIVTFDLTQLPASSNGPQSLVSNGVTLTIDNVLDRDGNAETLTNALGGLVLSGNISPSTLDLTFSENVRLVSYTVANDEADGNGAFFNVTQGALTSDNNDVSTLGSFEFANPMNLYAASSAVSLIVGDVIEGVSDGEVFSLSTLTIELASVSQVPLPAAAPFMLTGLAALGAMIRRRRRNA